MSYKKSILFLYIFALLFYSCGKEISIIDEEFYIPVKESNLYVRLVGNPNKPIIIDLHGGPGGNSGFNHEFYRHYLEEDYLVAYLDQRGCGKSDAVENTDLLTMRQYVEDLDAVVDTLQSNYQNKKINLFGSSWGGTYGYTNNNRLAPPMISNLWGAGGGMTSTLPDLMKYAKFQLDQENEVAMKSHEVVFQNGNFKVGYYWPIRFDESYGTYYSHHGGAFGTQNYLFIFPEKDLAISVIVNQNLMSETSNKLLTVVGGIMEDLK